MFFKNTFFLSIIKIRTKLLQLFFNKALKSVVAQRFLPVVVPVGVVVLLLLHIHLLAFLALLFAVEFFQTFIG